MEGDKNKSTHPQGIEKQSKGRKARPAREIHPPRRIKNTKISAERIQKYQLSDEWSRNQDYYFSHQEEIDKQYDGKWIEVSNDKIIGVYDTLQDFRKVIKTKSSFVIQAGMNFREKRRARRSFHYSTALETLLEKNVNI